VREKKNGGESGAREEKAAYKQKNVNTRGIVTEIQKEHELFADLSCSARAITK
jgi:hypothetical protein